MLNIVYVLTNAAMPGLVKIGYTTQENANSRIVQLYTTGVPVPFELEYACKVANAEEVEKALHIAFSPNRINPKREFFKIDPLQAIAILKLLHTEDATQEIELQETSIDQESVVAAQQLRSKRPNMDFHEMGIPNESVLLYKDGITEVKVLDNKKVNYLGRDMTLTAATREVMGIDYSVQPSPHWTFEGKFLKDIYESVYE